MKPLTGAELLAHHKGFDGSIKDAARAAGYVKVKADGGERVSLSGYRNALLAASGVEPLGGAAKASGASGRPLSYRATVLRQGHVVLGAPYLVQAGLGHGDQVEIKVSKGRVLLSIAGE